MEELENLEENIDEGGGARLSMRTTEKIIEMVDEVMNHLGYRSRTAVLEEAVRMIHKRTFFQLPTGVNKISK
jgi:hypothetical protein